MLFDNERILRLFNNAPNSHIIKFFFFIAVNQPKSGTRGFKINKLQLQFALKLGRTNFFEALHWLKDNSFLQELKIGDDSDFMVNPYIVESEVEQDARIKEWNRRCNLDIAREIRLKKERRRREAKKADQQ